MLAVTLRASRTCRDWRRLVAIVPLLSVLAMEAQSAHMLQVSGCSVRLSLRSVALRMVLLCCARSVLSPSGSKPPKKNIDIAHTRCVELMGVGALADVGVELSFVDLLGINQSYDSSCILDSLPRSFRSSERRRCCTGASCRASSGTEAAPGGRRGHIKCRPSRATPSINAPLFGLPRFCCCRRPAERRRMQSQGSNHRGRV